MGASAEPLTEARQATPAWLTQTLRRAGRLIEGRVTAVQKRAVIQTSFSVLTRLELSYSAGVPRLGPERVILKLPQPDGAAKAAKLTEREVAFYQVVAPQTPSPPTVRCYDAAFSPATGHGHLLLDDWAKTHSHPTWPLPPSVACCEQAVDALALLHAQWWDHPDLGQEIGTVLTESAVVEMMAGIAQQFARFADFLGDRLSGERRRVYEAVLSSSLRPWKRLAQRGGLTVVHGDVHLSNFLYPRAPAGAGVFLIDWQFWHLDVGARDLAFMMALHWYAERRAALELPLLRRYYDGLVSHGVTGYSWEDCRIDYRLGAIRNLTVPVVQWAGGLHPRQWWHRLECALLAYQDLDCAELLED
jgi:hypothetical protein